MSSLEFFSGFGGQVEDADEETFLLFSQELPSGRDLGFVDSKATTISVPLGDGGDEISLTQSPSLLSSSLSTGTTGAVLWRVSPLVASWMRRDDNVFFKSGSIGLHSTVVELGCGIAGITALGTAPRVGRYICTDQHYVLKLLRQNLADNLTILPKGHDSRAKGARATRKTKGHGPSKNDSARDPIALANIHVVALDWETSAAASLADEFEGLGSHLDMVLACDCIYNSHLVQPFVQTCVDLCKLREGGAAQKPIVCLIAQQLRSEDVFCEWLRVFMQHFEVWRLPEDMLPADLQPSNGFVLHMGILRTKSSAESI